MIKILKGFKKLFAFDHRLIAKTRYLLPSNVKIYADKKSKKQWVNSKKQRILLSTLS